MRSRSRPRHATLALAGLLAIVIASCSGGEPSVAPSAARSQPPASSQGAGATGGQSTTGPGRSGALESRSPALDRIAVTLEPFVTVEGGPLAIAAPDDGSGRMFVAAQDGRIWIVDGGVVKPEPLIDLSPRIRSGGEQGLLGLDVHPDFPDDPRLFVNYTDEAGDTIVASLSLDPSNPDRADPGSHRQLLFVDQPYANHNGGGALFGPDGYLYISLGDGGSGGDPHGNGQNLDALLGKILRLDVGGRDATAYTVPRDNPFVDGGGAPEIWQYGMRNPWRLSFDRATGDLWIGDVGQSGWEEVDVARAGTGGLNFGWNVMEGNHCFAPREGCDANRLAAPVAEYGRDLGCTIIGGYVYRGSAYPFLRGAYLFADYCSGRIFAIDASSDTLTAPVMVANESGGGISAFGEDEAGELYVTALDGTLSRIVATQR